jgi:hypothetical protein
VPETRLGQNAPAETRAKQRAALSVFVHGEMSARGLSNYLGEQLPNVSVEAFGRVKDFDRALELKPDALLSLPVVLKRRGHVITVRGIKAGKATEPYGLISFVDGLAPSQVTRLGLVGAMDRDDLQALVQAQLGIQPVLRVTTQLSDLLSLLEFELAQAAFVPQARLTYFRSRTKRPLYFAPIGAVELPALAATTPAGHEVVTLLDKLPRVSQTLGIDAWT